MQKKHVVALVPAYNEEVSIKATIKALKKITPLLISEIVVVDDGSTDNTAKVAKKAGAKVIRLETNLGKGTALNHALKNLNGDVLLLVDGDLGDSAIEARKLLEPVLLGEIDMAIGDLPKPEIKGGFGLVKKLAAWGIERLAHLKVNEPLSGQRALQWYVLETIGELDEGFGVEVGLTIDAVRSGFKVIEVPVEMSHAETGRNVSGFLHRGRQFFAVFRSILKRLG